MKENLTNENIEEIKAIINESKTSNMFTKLLNGYYFKNLSFYKLKSLFYRIEEIYNNLKTAIDKIEIENHVNDELDLEALEKDFYDTRKKTIKQVFPNLNLQRLKELYDTPPKSLKSPSSKFHINYDKVIVRKYVTAIMQMIFNKMDLVVAYCGVEGTGKTTASTQDAYLCHYILEQIGMIDYNYTLQNTMFFSLKSIIQAFGRWSKVPFKIFILDEGNELNRKNWGHPLVQLFVTKLRRERKHLRIIFINLPQLGELTTDLTLARINFIFQLAMKYNKRTKLVDKGDCAFFIVPRGEKVYSFYSKTELENSYIRDNLGKILDDKKKYYKLLPYYMCVQRFKKNGVWSFSEKEYDRVAKEANDQFNEASITLTPSEVKVLYKFIDAKKMGVKSKTKAYFTLTNLKNKRLRPIIKNTGLGEDFDSLEEAEI